MAEQACTNPPAPGTGSALRFTLTADASEGRCFHCYPACPSKGEVTFTEEAWGNKWRCPCCGRSYFYSIGD